MLKVVPPNGEDTKHGLTQGGSCLKFVLINSSDVSHKPWLSIVNLLYVCNLCILCQDESWSGPLLREMGK